MAPELKTSFLQAVVSDSIVKGCYLKDTSVMSCPGAGLNTLASQNIMIDLKSKNVERVAIKGGTNDLVERDSSDGSLCDKEEKMKKLVTLYKNEHF